MAEDSKDFMSAEEFERQCNLYRDLLGEGDFDWVWNEALQAKNTILEDMKTTDLSLHPMILNRIYLELILFGLNIFTESKLRWHKAASKMKNN